jgi:3-methyl-2-oxobutanoate hydroxymethyltransferase
LGVAKLNPEIPGAWKSHRPRPLALTAYDYAMARILDEAGVDILHVGDTLGMVVLGFPDTTHVTMDHMVHHTAAVARATPRALVTADLPIHAYDTPERAVANARLLVEAGADAVKMEGGREIADAIAAVAHCGIPVQGHLGMLPQHVLEEGGYKRKGKTPQQRDRLVEDALLLEKLGCFSVVLECVVPGVAADVTRAVTMPTIGIASGHECDGEIRVTHDVVGLFPWFVPPFIEPKERVAARIGDAVRRFRAEVLDE